MKVRGSTANKRYGVTPKLLSQMVELEDGILLEETFCRRDEQNFALLRGPLPVIVTAAHASFHTRSGKRKCGEIGTASLAVLLHKLAGATALYTNRPGLVDPNYDEECLFKDALTALCAEMKPRIILDIHGLHSSRETDCDLGSMHGQSLIADKDALKKLLDVLLKAQMTRVTFDMYSAGRAGTITRWANEHGIDAIQCEFNSLWLIQPGCGATQIARFSAVVDCLSEFLIQYKR